MPSKLQTGSSSARFDETLIVSDLKRLQQEVDDLKSRPNGSWKKFASSLGIVGGLLGILSRLVTPPKGLRDTVNSVHPEAKFKYESNVMLLKYDPVHPAFYLTVPIYIRNDGSATDTVDTAMGRLLYSPMLDSGTLESASTQEFDAGPGDFTFYDKPDKSDMIPLPIQIGSGEGKLVLISIDFDNMTFAKEGHNTLEVELTTGSKIKQTIQYCFYLDDQLIKELLSNLPPTGNTFRTPQC